MERRFLAHGKALLVCVGLGFVPVSRAQQDQPALAISKENRTIAITATDQVVQQAEIATVHIGFVVYGPTKDAVYRTASQSSNAIMEALTKAGVAKKDIQSEAQSITETQFFGQQPGTPDERHARAFTGQQSWTVRAKADDAARVLDVAVQAGANQSGQIEWSLLDPNAAMSEAAAKAIQRARTQASAMASGLGVRLGPLLYASNQVAASPIRPMPMEMRMQKAEATAAPPPLAINAREIETAATVYAVFALE